MYERKALQIRMLGRFAGNRLLTNTPFSGSGNFVLNNRGGRARIHRGIVSPSVDYNFGK